MNVTSDRLAGRDCLSLGRGGLGGGIACVRRGRRRGGGAARSHERLADIAAAIGPNGTHPTIVAFDVRDAAQVARGVNDAHAALGGLDVVVNAAAIDMGWARAGDMELAIWDDTIAINLSAPTTSAARRRAARPRPSIVNITSVAGIKAWAEDVAYNAFKAGIELMTPRSRSSTRPPASARTASRRV